MRGQAAWDEHAEFMDGLIAEGFVVVGGPLAGGERILLVIEAEDEAVLRARLASDPWTTMGLLVIESAEAWTILLEQGNGASADGGGVMRAW